LSAIKNNVPPLFEDASEDSAFGHSLGDVVDLETHSKMLQEYHLQTVGFQRVLVVQPYARTGSQAVVNTRREYLLDETLGLMDTLGWNVVDTITLNLNESLQRSTLLGPGQLENIKAIIEKIENPEEGKSEPPRGGSYITSVFISTFRLTPGQVAQIEEVVGKPVLDRYNVVLQIFKLHATSREAKLQVQLAEIPYLRARLDGDHELELLRKHSKGRMGEDFFIKQRTTLARREKRIKSELQKLVVHRATIRKQRQKLSIPSIAIVGYTNAGKTSLIKAITGENRLKPLNKLFATLDVTVHGFELPSKVKSLFVDTVGFISDIPTTLIASFNSTLEDALMADVLVHVRDMSNPDHVAQDENVIETLERINVPPHLMKNMIVVGNKIDLLDPHDWKLIKDDGIIPVSCKAGYGLNYLLDKIDKAVLTAKGKQRMVIKVPVAGGAELEWLRKNATVSSVEMDQSDGGTEEHWNVAVLINDIEFSRFKKKFLGKRGIIENSF